MTEPNEPSITINGIQLTTGQAMTVRVALQAFAMDLQNNGQDTGGQDTGDIGPLYLQRIREINRLISKT